MIKKRLLVKIKLTNHGFTIIELMIALTALSTILIMATVIMIQIGGLYTKGVNAANVQNTNRSVTSSLTSDIQFSGAKPNLGQTKVFAGSSLQVSSLCVGTSRYSYIVGYEQGTDPTAPGVFATVDIHHVLWKDTIGQDKTCAPLNITTQVVYADSSSSDSSIPNPSGGYDMVPDKIRLLSFNVTPVSSTSDIYNVQLGMAYGDDAYLNPPNYNTCIGSAGTQYCATSNISSTVEGRTY